MRKSLRQAQEEHAKFLKKMGIPKRHKLGGVPYDMERTNQKLPPLSNSLGNGFVKSVDDWKWKGKQEKPETIREIEAKRKRVAPAYNKGATQYITDGADTKDIGR